MARQRDITTKELKGVAETIVPIRSVKQYLKEFGNDGIGRGAKPSLIHDQVLDAFQKEIFGQITMKYHDAELLSRGEETVDDATREGIRHILENANRKWKRLCIEFSKYKETYNLIQPGELMERMRDIVKIQEEKRKDPDGTPVDIGTESDVVILDE